MSRIENVAAWLFLPLVLIVVVFGVDASAEGHAQQGLDSGSPPMAQAAPAGDRPGIGATGGSRKKDEIQPPIKAGRQLNKVTTSGPVQEGPLRIDPLSIDFGLVAPRSKLSQTVTITNTSSKPVTLKQLMPTCQCTSILDDLIGKVLEPGESVPMELTMETPASPLIKQAAVMMVVSDHDRAIKVEVVCEVTLMVRAVPPFIDIQQNPLDNQDPSTFTRRSLKGELVVESIDQKSFRILSSLSPSIRVVNFDPENDEPRNRYTLNYDFTGVPCNKIPKYAVLETDRADCPALDLRVRHECAVIAPPFSVEAFVAGVGNVTPGGNGEFEMVVKKKPTRTSPDGATVLMPQQIVGVVSRTPGYKAELISATPDNQSINCRVRVTPPGDHRGLFSIPVYFSDGSREAEVTVFGVVR